MNSSTDNAKYSARSAARLYIARGFAPIPLPMRSKKPRIEGWTELRVTEAEIDAMFASNGNIGLLIGLASRGLIDIDLDCPEAIRAADVLLPPTGMISGRQSAPRSHWWYRVEHPPDRAAEAFDDPSLARSEGVRLLELRSTGGQTMVPPSVHPKGERCIWHENEEPTLISIDVLRTAARGVAAAALLGRYWPQGGRHEASLALAGALLRSGWLQEPVERFVRAVCAAAMDDEVEDRVRTVRDTDGKLGRDNKATGWPTLAQLLGRNGQAIVERVQTWLGIKCPPGTPDRPRAMRRASIPPYTPFPTALLPAVVRAYVETTAAAMNCDSCFSALPAIAALGAAIGATHVVSPKRGWKEPPYIWALSIGKSGAVKSPPYRDVEDAAEDINDQLEREYEVFRSEFESKREDWEAKESGQDDPGPPPKPPVRKVFIKGDVTIEALVGALQDNPRGLLIGQDELSAWVGGFVKYTGKAGTTDLPRWLQLHSAGTINYTRKTGDPHKREVRVRGVGVSVTGTIQPRILSRVLTEEFRVSGFLARLLLAMPPWKSRQWTEMEVDDNSRSAFADLLRGVQQLPMDSWPDGRACPHLIRLSNEAKALFVAFYNANGDALASADDDMSAARSKLEGYALRFALIFHCCRLKERAKNESIAAEDMQAAIALTEWFRAEAERVYMVLGESPEEQDARRLFELVVRLAERHGGRLTVAQLQRSNQRKYTTASIAEIELESLVTAGFGYWEVIPPGPRGGRPTRAFVPFGMCDETAETPSGDSGGGVDRLDEFGPGVTKPPQRDETFRLRAESKPDASNSFTHGPVATETVSSVSSHSLFDSETIGESSPGSAEWFSHSERDSSRMTATLVTSAEKLPEVISAILDGDGMVGLDIETTGLNHQTDRARLLQIATTRGTFLIDVFRFEPAALVDLFAALAKVEIVGHNLGFDLPFLIRLGFTPGRALDTMLASQLLGSGDRTTKHALKDVTQRTLGVALDKELQKVDWSGAVTPEMLRYAALDAEIPVRLWEKLAASAGEAKLTAVLAIEMNALPCIAWASVHGIGFDRAAWELVARDAEGRRDQLHEQLDAIAPNTGDLFVVTNWNSPKQVLAVFRKLGIALESTDDDALAAVDHPLAEGLREYRSAAKLVSVYGEKWLKHVAADGRVYANWRQIGAGASGRMSCKEPNLQQLPRDVRYRKCFIAPPGRVLVKADYSQIELRIAAKIAGDQRMQDAYRNGEDLHSLTARNLLGKSEVTKADRQLAKAVNFGLLYGQGANGLMRYALANYGVKLTEAEAARYRAKFFATYPGLRRWHRSIGDRPQDTRTLAGRRREAVVRFTEKLNTPVQGTGADGLKRALGLLWGRRAECPGAFPVLIVHDEIVVECDEDWSDPVSAWLVRAMSDGMAPLIDPVPVGVEVSVGTTWDG